MCEKRCRLWCRRHDHRCENRRAQSEWVFHAYITRIVSSIGRVHETRGFAGKRHPHLRYCNATVRAAELRRKKLDQIPGREKSPFPSFHRLMIFVSPRRPLYSRLLVGSSAMACDSIEDLIRGRQLRRLYMRGGSLRRSSSTRSQSLSGSSTPYFASSTILLATAS